MTPDLELHCQRAVRSARNMGLASPLSAGEIQEIVLDGVAKFPSGTALYIRPFMWSTAGWMQPDPASTRIAISLTVTPMPEPKPYRVMLSRFRRPSPETAPTDAKAVCLYAQAGRAAGEAVSKGFNDAVMLDPMGNVAEYSSANLWIAKDGAAITPAPNGTFLNGITRQRLIKLFTAAGVPVYERSFGFQEVLEADEVFSSGNFGKVLPVTGVEDREKPIGAIYSLAAGSTGTSRTLARTERNSIAESLADDSASARDGARSLERVDARNPAQELGRGARRLSEPRQLIILVMGFASGLPLLLTLSTLVLLAVEGRKSIKTTIGLFALRRHALCATSSSGRR